MRCDALVLAAVLVSPSLFGEDREITVDWIFSDEGEAIAKAPDAEWTADGDVMLLDGRVPKAARTIERVRPDTGARSPAVEARAALSSLGALLGGKDVPEALEWPPSFDGSGRAAVYVYGGDLYRLDLEASRFERLTRTDAEEMAPRLSPDGRKLAFVRGNDLWVLDLATKTETRLTSDGSETVLNGRLSWLYWEEVFDHKDAGYWWSEDSSAIAFLRTNESAVSVMSFVDFAPAVPRVIQQRYPKAGGANPSVWLGVVEVGTRKTVWLDPSAVPYEYIVQLKWLKDGRGLGVETLNRSQDRTDLYLVDRGTGAARHVLTETDPAWVNLIDFHFLADGRHLVATSQRDGHTHLYRYTLDGERVNAVTQGPWSVRAVANWQFSTLAATLDEARGVAYFTANEKSLAERQLYRVGLDGSGMQRLSMESGSHDGPLQPGPPPLPGLALEPRHAALPLSPRPERGDDGRPGSGAPRPARVVRHAVSRAADDPRAATASRLQARIYKPAGFDPKRRYPLIVYVYGEPNAPAVVDAWRTWPPGNVLFEQVLLESGYLVATVDPRSATGGHEGHGEHRPEARLGAGRDLRPGRRRALAEGAELRGPGSRRHLGLERRRDHDLARRDPLGGVEGRDRRGPGHRPPLLRHEVRRGLHEDPRGEPRGLRRRLAGETGEGPARPAAARPRHLRRQRPSPEHLGTSSTSWSPPASPST